jgi:hypothetical protein
MRSAKLVAVLAAIPALLALSAVSASARRASSVPHAGRPCRVHVEVPTAPITEGESVTIFGSLQCPTPEEAGGKHVLLFEQSAGGKAGFAQVAEATTETSGAFQLTPPIFDTNSTFYVVSQGAKSAHKTIRVAVQITPTPPTPVENAQLLTGGGAGRRLRNEVTFAGKVNPADRGAHVGLQRENATASEEWRRIDVGTVNQEGEYSIKHVFSVPGDANIRVVVRPKGINAPAATTPVSYEISQTQNQRLTIESTADPLPYGQSATINGVVASAATGTPLTLLAHGRGGQFAPVGTGSTSDSKGDYSFAVKPLTNTLYRVTDATTNSAVLFEGVKYALTFTPPASTVQAGQPLTFSGTVLPVLAGHPVYIERQGSLKLGWHVVDVGAVSAPANPSDPNEPGSFSIVHAFYAAGTDHLRIKIPGDPGNQGAAAQAFDLTVTAAPASTLKPLTPGNSKMPGEGQL